MLEEFREKVYHIHDVECNQKYDGLPYSFHLKAVEAQGEKFMYLIPKMDITINTVSKPSSSISIRDVVRYAINSHDILEDCRKTYNDIIDMIVDEGHDNYIAYKVADIVYCLTDEKGKNRAERKNDKYYKELSENQYAIFVKLADIAANTLYSKLMNTSMYDTYKKEFPKFKEKVYVEEYKEFFDYVESL